MTRPRATPAKTATPPPQPSQARRYPALGRYRSLTRLHPDARPADYPTTIEDFVPPPKATDAPRVDPARRSNDGIVRWCATCDTVLKKTGRSPFCDRCRSKYKSLQAKRRRWHKRGAVDVPVRDLTALFDAARDFEQQLGPLTRAYNTDPTNLQSQMDAVMRRSKDLLRQIQRIPDPTQPAPTQHPTADAAL